VSVSLGTQGTWRFPAERSPGKRRFCPGRSSAPDETRRFPWVPREPGASRPKHPPGSPPAAVLPETGVADETARVDGVDAVERALGRLSQDHREIVVLRFYSHLNEQQIAEAFGIAPGTVKSRLSRALDRLSTDTDLADLDGGRLP
jgi:DNA-directed RNA polymerase specialized sigma24 family protein